MNEKLQEINKENILIYIYFILLFIYLYANKVEINYIMYQKKEDKEEYRLLLYLVFGVTFIISLYNTVESINNLKINKPIEVLRLEKNSILANILIVIATGIYLYIIYKDEDINLELNL